MTVAKIQNYIRKRSKHMQGELQWGDYKKNKNYLLYVHSRHIHYVIMYNGIKYRALITWHCL